MPRPAWLIRSTRTRAILCDPHVNSIAVQADGKILVVGQFGSIGGQTRNRVARLLVPLGDFNSDGFTDYLLFNANTRRTAIWHLHGNAFQSGVYGPTLPDGWTIACVADVNRDGNPDYILFNDTTRRTAIWYLSGATLINSVFGPSLPPGYQLIAASDVNRDTHVDYVLFNLNTHRTAFWFLNGNAVVTGTVFGPTLTAGWNLIDSLDFNSDGKPDLLLSQLSPSIRPTAIWYLDGAARTASAFGPTQPLGWALTGAADFNNDGKPDYVLFQPATRRTAQWYLDGVTRVGSAFGPTLPAGYSLAFP